MSPTVQQAPYWWRILLSLAEGLLTFEVLVQKGLTTAFRGVKSIVGGAHNLTISTYQHFARTLQAPAHVDDSNGFYTVLLSPGCEDIAPNCVLRTFDITEDLKGVTAIAAGPRPFAIASPNINIDSWRLPTFYAYNPWNSTSQADSHGDSFLAGSPDIPILGADPSVQVLHLPSSDKALALVNQPLAAIAASGDLIPVHIAATCLGIAISLSLSYLLFWCVGWIPASKQQWKKANLDAYIAGETKKAVAQINTAKQRKVIFEEGYVAAVNGLSEDLRKSKVDRESIQLELETCESDKVTTESKLRKCTTEKETAERKLHQCTSNKEEVEAQLEKTVDACSKADEQVQSLRTDVTETESKLQKAKMEVICVQKEAEEKAKAAEQEYEKKVNAAIQDAENKVKLTKADAEKEIKAAQQEANKEVKQAKDEANKAISAQKEAEENIESMRQEFEKNLASAEQEATRKFNSAERAAEEKLKSTQQEAKKAAKLAEEEADKNIKSLKDAAETELNTTTAKHEQREKELQEELSRATTTIGHLKPSKDEAGRLSKEVEGLRDELSHEQKARRQDESRLTQKHSTELEELKKQHDDEVEDLNDDQEKDMQKLREELRKETDFWKGEANGYVAMEINLGNAEAAKSEARKEAKFLRQQLDQVQASEQENETLKSEKRELDKEKTAIQNQLRDARQDNENLEANCKKLSDENTTVQHQLRDARQDNKNLKIDYEKLGDENNTLRTQLEGFTHRSNAKSNDSKEEKKSLQEKLQSTDSQLKTATTRPTVGLWRLSLKRLRISSRLLLHSAKPPRDLYKHRWSRPL